jgi:hypothetical protein
MSSSLRSSAKSESESDRSHSRLRRNILTVDQLFPSETNKSGTKGKRLDINSLFSGTATNPDVVIDIGAETLIERKKKRKDDLQRQYMLEYKRCWERIDAADLDRLNETIFEVLPEVERFPEYSPVDCVELIQDKLRTEEFMDTVILGDNKSIYISWANIEANRDKFIEEAENEERSKTEKDITETERDDVERSDENGNDTEEMRKDFDAKIKSMVGPISETERDTEHHHY